MKKMKQLIALMLTVCMILSFTGCGNKGEKTADSNATQAPGTTETTVTPASTAETEKPEKKEPVTLVWWYPGNGEQRDTQKVNDYLNEQLKSYEGLEHVTVILHPLTYDQYATQITLGISSGEQMDLLGSFYKTPLQPFVDDGTVISIEQYMASVPELTATLPEWLMAYGRFRGEQYMIPNYQQASTMGYTILPADYITKGYITEENFKKLSSVKTPLAERAQLIEELTNAVRAGENSTTKYAPLIANWFNGANYRGWYDAITTNFVLHEGTTEVVYRPFEEDTKLSYQVAADWYAKGLVPADPTTNYDDLSKKNMINDVAAVISGNQGLEDADSIAQTTSAQYGFDVSVAYEVDHPYSSYSWGAGGNSVTATCEHPEEAVKLLECMSIERGKELYNTVVYGLEGTHWEFTDKDQGIIKTLDYDGSQTDSSAPYGQMKWLMGNTFNAYINQSYTKAYNEAALKLNDETVTSPITGITFDLSSVQSKIDQINAVWGEYKDALIYGSKGDKWEAYYNEFKTKVEKAGVTDVLAEMQKQVDTYLAGK